MRARLAGNRHAAFFRLAQQRHAARRAQMLAMHFACPSVPPAKCSAPRSFPRPPPASRASPAPCSNNLRASRRRSRANNPGNDPSPAGRTSSRIRSARRISSLFCTQWPSSVIATTPACFSEPMGASSSPAMFLRDRAGDENIHHAFARRAFADQRDGAGIVNRRRRVRHANDGSESAARRRRRAGGDGFLGRLARLAQMHVQINQPRTDHQPFDVQPLRVCRRLRRGVASDRRNFAVRQSTRPPPHPACSPDQSPVRRSAIMTYHQPCVAFNQEARRLQAALRIGIVRKYATEPSSSRRAAFPRPLHRRFPNRSTASSAPSERHIGRTRRKTTPKLCQERHLGIALSWRNKKYIFNKR